MLKLLNRLLLKQSKPIEVPEVVESKTLTVKDIIKLYKDLIGLPDFYFTAQRILKEDEIKNEFKNNWKNAIFTVELAIADICPQKFNKTMHDVWHKSHILTDGGLFVYSTIKENKYGKYKFQIKNLSKQTILDISIKSKLQITGKFYNLQEVEGIHELRLHRDNLCFVGQRYFENSNIKTFLEFTDLKFNIIN